MAQDSADAGGDKQRLVKVGLELLIVMMVIAMGMIVTPKVVRSSL